MYKLQTFYDLASEVIYCHFYILSYEATPESVMEKTLPKEARITESMLDIVCHNQLSPALNAGSIFPISSPKHIFRLNF
jgi:hypothetical protein